MTQRTENSNQRASDPILTPAPRLSAGAMAIALSGAALLAACGQAAVPKELNDAREAYAVAKVGPPAELAPAQLEEGRQALERAEASFDKNKDKPETVDLSYVALRQIQVAESAAALQTAKRDEAAATKEAAELQSELQRATEAALSRTEAALAKERQNANKTKAELEQERKARQEAEKKLSAALASLEKVAQVKEESRGVVITLSGSVLFESGKYELLPIAQSKLDEVAQALKDQGYKKIIVEGHTDSRGGDEANLTLSQRRADSVRTYLVSRGIDSAKITSVGIGEARPVADNESAEGRANNRRVELVVTPE